MTGYGEPHTGRAKKAGADVIVTKPLKWSVVLDGMLPAREKSRAA